MNLANVAMTRTLWFCIIQNKKFSFYMWLTFGYPKVKINFYMITQTWKLVPDDNLDHE